MKFTKYTFLLAGISGIILLFPLYFLENTIANDFPPSITHPEFYYGFIGVALGFQILFIMISINPTKYRMMMIPAMIEKFSFAIAVIILYLQNRVSTAMLGGGLMDLAFGLLFILAFARNPQDRLYRSF